MDDLISRQDLIDRINGLMKSPWFLDGYVGLKDMAESKLNEFQIIDRLKWDERKNAVVIVRDFCVRGTPAVPAVPMDKLCVWLERYATMDCDGCKEAFGSCENEENQEESVCNSRERWKAMLTNWMEGLNDHR